MDFNTLDQIAATGPASLGKRLVAMLEAYNRVETSAPPFHRPSLQLMEPAQWV